MADRSEESRPTWRTMPDSGTAGWRRKDANADSELPWVFKLAAMVLGLAALFVYFGWKVLYSPKALPMIVLSVTDYSEPLPPNSQALEDVERFNQTFAGSNVICSVADESGNLLQQLRDFLNSASPGGPGQNWLSDRGAVAIYISAHGVLNEQGEPCLLPSQATIDSSEWVSIDSVLETITDHQRLSSATKILMLDAGKIRNAWEFGVIDNGFAAALEESVLSAREKDPNLYVLNSSRDDQQTHACPEFTGSFFGAAVALGLSGAADLSNDNHVTVAELGQFVSDWVHQQVHKYRTRDQRPLLIPNEQVPDDASLAFAAQTQLPIPAWSHDFASSERVLQMLWERREALVQGADEMQPFVSDPLLWAALNRQLTRLESILFAGSAYSFEQELSMAREVLARFERALPTQLPDALNTGLAERLQSVSAADISAAHDRIRQQLSKPEEPLEPLKQPLPRLAYDLAMWRHAVGLGTQLSISNLTQLFQTVDALSPRSTAYVGPGELLWCRVLVRHGLASSVDRMAPELVRIEDLFAQATSIGSFRSQHWFAEDLRGSAERLRQIRDLVLVGEVAALSKVDELLTGEAGVEENSGGRLLRLIESKKVHAEAEFCRDLTMSQLTELARWHLAVDPAATESVDRLTRELHQLTRLLLRGGAYQETTSEIAAQTEHVTKLHRALTDKLLARSSELSQTNQLSARDLVDAERLLATSLIPTTDRKRLRQKYFDELMDHRDSLQDDRLVFPIEGAAQTEEPTTIVFTQDNRSHVALETLAVGFAPGRLNPLGAIEFSGADSAQRFQMQATRAAEVGGVVRNYLLDFANIQEQLIDQTRNELAADHAGPPRPTESRKGIATADVLTRSAAASLIRSTDANNASTMLRKLDRDWVLLAEAMRYANDFLGPRVSGRYLFESQAGQLVSHVTGTRNDLRPQRFVANVKLRIDELIDVADRWQPAQVAPVSILEEQQVVDSSVAVTGSPGLPAGVASYELVDDAGVNVKVREGNDVRHERFGVTTDSRDTERPLSFSISRVMRDTGAVDLNRIFRGHVAPTRIFLRQLSGPRVSWQRDDAEAPTVHVINDRGQLALVLFVLDCSYSMAATHQVEGGGMQNRLQIARAALATVVDSLDAEAYRVGLLAYGHRINTKDGALIWPEKKAGRPNPSPGTTPGTDVEPLLAPRMPDVAEFDAATSRLRPWGKTPLNYSIRQAISMLQADNRPNVASKHIVVLTDGADDVPDNSIPLPTIPADIKLSVLFCGFPTTTPQVGRLQEITARAADQWQANRATFEARADVLDVRKPTELVAGFEQLLQVDRFCVVPRGELPLPEGQMRMVGDTWPVESFRTGAYTVYARATNGNQTQAEIELAGGERVLLQLNRRPYELVFPAFGPEGRSGREQRLADGFIVIPQRTDLHGNGVTLRVSLQNVDSKSFTPRPTHVWAEVRPLPDRAPVVFFQDCEFERNQPVPVLRFRLDDFPHREAELRLWFTFSNKLSDAFDHSVSDLTDGRVLDRNGTKFTLKTRGQNLLVVESAETTVDEHLFPSRIAISPPADWITRQYDMDGRQVTHEFRWQTPLDTSPRLRIGAKFDQNWMATDPIEISW